MLTQSHCLQHYRFPRACLLLTDSVLDFGCIAANSQVVSKRHPITNEGTAPGKSIKQFRL